MAKSIQINYLQEDGSYEVLYPFSNTSVATAVAFTRISYSGTNVLNEGSFTWDSNDSYTPPSTNIYTMFLIMGHEYGDDYIDICIDVPGTADCDNLVLLSKQENGGLVNVKYTHNHLSFQGDNVWKVQYSEVSDGLTDEEKIRASMNFKISYKVFLLGRKQYSYSSKKGYNVIVNENINNQ